MNPIMRMMLAREQNPRHYKWYRGGSDGSTLNLDFTQMSELDSRFTFSRSSTATVINSSGLVQYAAANLMTYSEDQGNNTTWSAFGTSVTRTTAQSDPLGGSSAIRLSFDATSSDAVISRTVSVNNGLPYVISMWMRSDSGTVTNVRFARSDAAAGAIFPTLTTTWQRVELPFTASSASSGIEIRVLNSGSPKTATIHVFGAQLEPGSVMRSYQPATGGTAYHAPRFDYDPTTLAPRGLLIEGSVTNLLMYSGDWTQSGAGFWSGRTNINTGVTWTGFTAPDNSASAIKLIPNTTNARHSIENNSTQMNGATVYTVSMFFKADGYSVAGIVIAGGQTRRNFTLSGAGSLGSQFGLTNTATITPYANGWYRCSVTWTTSGSGSLGAIGVWASIPQNETTDPATHSWVGDNTSGIQCWGAQVEASSGASSYIPTGISSVQRAAESCSMTGTNFSSWYNQSEGTVLAKWRQWNVGGNEFAPAARFALASGITNSIWIGKQNAASAGRRIEFEMRDSSGTQRAQSVAGSVTDPVITAAGAQKFGDTFGMSYNGNTTVSTVQTRSPAPDRLFIGSYDATSGHINSTIARLVYWPTRLPDATLQSLTQ